MIIAVPQVLVTFSRYLLLSLRYSFRRKPLMSLLLILWIVSVWSVSFLLTGPIGVLDFLKKAPVGALFMLVFLLLPLQIVWGTWRQYKASPLFQSATDYTLSNTGLRVSGHIMHTDLAWAAFTRADQFGSWLLLQTSEQSAFFLDLRQVASPASAAEVIRMVQSGGISVH